MITGVRHGQTATTDAGCSPCGRDLALMPVLNGSAIDSCTIITGEPNEAAAHVHDWMPVILSPEDYDAWLDPKTDAERLQSLLVPYPAEEMAMRPVSTRVNSPRNDEPECVEGIAERE